MIFGLLALIVVVAVALTLGRARGDDGHDDDDDNTPGGPRRLRSPVRVPVREPLSRNPRGPR
ncbi:MAG: hypothetical protein ACK4LQ_00470 [Pararhodobacter sp.]